MMTGIDKVLGTVVQAIEIEKFGYEFYHNMREFVSEIEVPDNDWSLTMKGEYDLYLHGRHNGGHQSR